MTRKNSGIISPEQKNGITITDSISLTVNSKFWLNAYLMLIITALAGIAGFTLSFLSLFDFATDNETIYKYEIIVYIICSVIFIFPVRAKLLMFPLIAYIGIKSYIYQEELAVGYAQFINIIAKKIKITQNGNDYYLIKKEADIEQCLNLFLVFIFVIIVIIICYNTIIKPRFIVVFSCTFPFIETGLFFGFSPNHTAFSILISYWIALFAMRVAGNQFHSTSGQPVFVRRKNIFVSSGNLKNNVIEDIGMITMSSVFIILMLASAVLNISSFKRSEKINSMRHSIKTAISDFSVEKMIYSLQDNPERVPITDASRLGNLSKITFSNNTDLTVLISESVDHNMYIRGFIGNEYKNNTWYANTNQKIVQEDLFDSMGKFGIYPQQFNGLNDAILSSVFPEQIKKLQMIVKPSFKSVSYMFTPYGLITPENMHISDDAFVRSDNMSEYKLSFYSTPEYYKNMNMIYSNLSSFQKNTNFMYSEIIYRKFVYDTYLDIPDNENITYLMNKYSSIPKYNGTNASEIYTYIKNILVSSASYTLEPGKTPSDKDIVYYLLEENHKGYCSHFATAGIILARMAGLPARYAEGYVIIPTDFDQQNKINTYYKLDIKDSRAHAWAEFYIDGYGWVPFEFTPGYDKGIISSEEKNETQETKVSVVTVTVPVTVTEPVVVTKPVPVENPVVTTVVGSGTPNSETGDNSNKPNAFFALIKKVFLFILSILLVILIIFMTIFIRHIIYTRNRIKSFKCNSNRESILNVYEYVLKLLAHCGISSEGMLPLDFAEYVEQNNKAVCHEGEMTELVKLALKSSFSNKEAEHEEVINAIKISSHIAKKIYSKKSKYEKLIFKYILNFIR